MASASEIDDCLKKSVVIADDTTTVEELRRKCEENFSEIILKPRGALTPIENRVKVEKSVERKPFVLSTHQPNFFLPISYMRSTNNKPFNAIDEDVDLDNWEAVFQISFKLPIVYDLFDSDSDLFFGYTSRSWWQMYNSDLSSAFRETNYKPELFVRHYSDSGPEFWGVRVAGWEAGIIHESNGRSQMLSRSWNRAFVSTAIDADDFSLLLNVWYRFKESKENDDNPDIYRYLGYGDIRFIYTPNQNTFTAMFRPGTEENGMELTWSRPIGNSLRVYALYYHGYGESLLDYDEKMERFGIGIALNDFLQR